MARATGKCIDGSQRIASLLPSATEILGDLGVPIEWMVGISHECDIFRDETSTQQLLQHSRILTYSSFDPNTMSQLEIDSLVKEDAQRIQKKCMLSEITGLNVVETKNISEIYSINTHELIESNPNLIFTQSLCGVCAVNSIDVQNTIRNTNIKNCNIVNLSPSSLQEVKESFEIVSEACGLSKECGQELVEKFHTDLKFVKDAVSAIEDKSDDKKRRPRVLLLEWLEPVFTGGHWIQEMIECAGCAPVLSESAKRSVERSWADVVETDPDCIIIACCGFDLKRNLDDARKFLFNDSTFGKQLRQMRATKNGKLFAVDGNRYFARPSPSLSAGVAIIARIAHDDQTEICRILEASDLLPLETKGWERVSSKSDANENKVYRLEDMEDLNVLTSWQRVHEEACKEHLDHYIDPATGYFVFTKYAHQKRGYCCGKGCRHCAYFHANVKMSERTKRIQRPSFLHQRCSHENNELPFKVLFFSGGKDSFIALREIASHQNTCSNIILLTTFDNHSRIIPEQDIHIDMVVKQAKHLGIPLIGVPLSPGDEFQQKIIDSMELIYKTYGSKSVQSFVFGDLHLQDIRDWRDKELMLSQLIRDKSDWLPECLADDFRLEYPNWLKKYESLLNCLEDAKVPVEVTNVTEKRAKSFVMKGSAFTRDIFLELESVGLDGFGENGEYHTLAKVWENEDRNVVLGIV